MSEQLLAGSGGSHSSPIAVSVMSLPQLSSLSQFALQPSPSSLLPSSQSSPASTSPLPQYMALHSDEQLLAGSGGSHDSPASQSMMPLPQLSLLWQSAPQPSPPSLLPSSQISPASNTPLPQYMASQEGEQLLAGFGGSHSSPASQSTMPLPQLSLLAQPLEQPSPSSLLPSSQISPGSTTPLPQYMALQDDEQSLAGLGGSQSSPASQSTILLPQISVLLQSALQPSPPSVLPSSHASPGSITPLPHPCTLQSAPQSAMVAGSAGSQASPASQSVIPLPQLSSLRQSPLQPSPPSKFPSSHTSPGSTIPLPQPVSLQVAVQPPTGSGGSHSSPATQSVMPLPQLSSLRQSELQPSPPSELPSSQTSPGSVSPLPQYMNWHDGEQSLAGPGGSHSSPASQSTMLFPHCSLLWQSALQPSPPAVFPSSQSSPASTAPLPQAISVHDGEQLLAGPGGSHSSPASQSMMPLPQLSSLAQSDEQPSPPAQLPSSHTSPASWTPLPQYMATHSAEQLAAASGGSHSSPASESIMPLPQLSLLPQSAEQPSPETLLPSSQTSPGSTTPLLQNMDWHEGEHAAAGSGGSHCSPASQSVTPLPQLSLD